MKKDFENSFNLKKNLFFSNKFIVLVILSCLILIVILGYVISFKIKNNNQKTVKFLNMTSKNIASLEIKIEKKLNEKQQILYEKNKLNFVEMEGNRNKPKIAIVIDDMGIDIFKSKQMLEIPEIYNFSYLTYAKNLQSQIDYAKSVGKEILLHIPMESVKKFKAADYGGTYLTTEKSPVKNLEVFKSMLGDITGYIGINNHMGSKFTSNYKQLYSIVNELKNMGLMFLDSKTINSSKGDEIASKIKLPYISRDVFLDDSDNVDDILKSLKHLENIAIEKGYVVAIGHPKTNTITAIKTWLKETKQKYSFVPISFLIDNVKK